MSKYDRKEATRTPRTTPHLSIAELRAVSGKTLEQVCEAVAEALGEKFTRGALCAIEKGHRGASEPVLRALEYAYGLREGALVTDYAPRARKIEDPAA